MKMLIKFYKNQIELKVKTEEKKEEKCHFFCDKKL